MVGSLWPPPKNPKIIVIVVCYCCESRELLLKSLRGVCGFVLTAGRVCSLCGDLGETEGVC